MIRLDRRRLETAIFPDRIEVATRIDDLDVQGHVNNVAVAVILQESRGRFDKRLIATHLGGAGLAVGGIVIDYAGQLYHPDPVEVSIGVLEIGRSSFVLGQIVRQNGRIAVYAEVVLITTAGDRSTPMTAPMRAALENVMIVQR